MNQNLEPNSVLWFLCVVAVIPLARQGKLPAPCLIDNITCLPHWSNLESRKYCPDRNPKLGIRLSTPALSACKGECQWNLSNMGLCPL